MTEPTPPGLEPAVADAALDAPVDPEPIAAPVDPEPIAAPVDPEPIAAPADPGTSVPPEAPPHAPVPTEHPWPSDSAADRSPGRGLRRPAVLGYLGALILGVAIGAAGLALATGALGGGSASPSPVPSETPGAGPSEPPAGNSIGRPDAPVTIEVWADYQCPFCRLEDVLFGGALDREYVTPGIARIVYRDFAFLGQESTDAAVAARCAGAQDPGARLRFHDALYTFQQGENQGRFARANLLQLAEMAGVPSVAVFTSCLDDPAVAGAVADETAAGRSAGVSSTPTLLLRGPGGERVLAGFSKTWPTLRDALEAVRVATPGSPSPTGSPAP
jgi:protein-disulfide isomerase